MARLPIGWRRVVLSALHSATHAHACTELSHLRVRGCGVRATVASTRTTGLAQLTRGKFIGNTCCSEFESEAQPEAQANEVSSVRVP